MFFFNDFFQRINGSVWLFKFEMLWKENNNFVLFVLDVIFFVIIGEVSSWLKLGMLLIFVMYWIVQEN